MADTAPSGESWLLRGRGRQLQKWQESPGASRGQCDRAAAVPHLENGPHLEDAEMTQLTEGALQRGLAASGALLYQRLTFNVCGQIPSHFSFPIKLPFSLTPGM